MPVLRQAQDEREWVAEDAGGCAPPVLVPDRLSPKMRALLDDAFAAGRGAERADVLHRLRVRLKNAEAVQKRGFDDDGSAAALARNLQTEIEYIEKALHVGCVAGCEASLL